MMPEILDLRAKTTCPEAHLAYQAGDAKITGKRSDRMPCFCADCYSAYNRGMYDAAKAELERMKK